jgi:hypothetical protein
MKQRAVALIADYLSNGPSGHSVGLKPAGDDDYVLPIEDARNERVTSAVRRATSSRGLDRSRKTVTRCRRSDYADAAGRSTATVTSSSRSFAPAVPCRAELAELALELYLEEEVEWMNDKFVALTRRCRSP